MYSTVLSKKNHFADVQLLMCSDHEFALWPCSLPFCPLRPPQWRPVRWRLWSVCPQHTPRPEWAKLWSWRTRRWPWSSSSSPTSKRSVLLCLPKNGTMTFLSLNAGAKWCDGAWFPLQVLEKEKKRSRQERESGSEEEEDEESSTQRSQRTAKKR